LAVLGWAMAAGQRCAALGGLTGLIKQERWPPRSSCSQRVSTRDLAPRGLRWAGTITWPRSDSGSARGTGQARKPLHQALGTRGETSISRAFVGSFEDAEAVALTGERALTPVGECQPPRWGVEASATCDLNQRRAGLRCPRLRKCAAFAWRMGIGQLRRIVAMGGQTGAGGDRSK